MRYKGFFMAFVAMVFLLLISCSEDIGINDFKYQCKTDNDCQSGYVCDKSRGCVKAQRDAGMDGGEDAMADVSDVSDIRDIEDIIDIQDAGDIVDAGDIGDVLEDVEDTGDILDATEDVEDIQDVSDIGDIENVEDIIDIGDDGGIDVGVNYVSRLESVYDSSAGVCTSPNYILESVTGFTSRDEMKSSNYILRGSMLFSK